MEKVIIESALLVHSSGSISHVTLIFGIRRFMHCRCARGRVLNSNTEFNEQLMRQDFCAQDENKVSIYTKLNESEFQHITLK